MTYQPVVPMGGNAGWAFLKRTQAVQQAAFDASPALVRDVDHFREKIGSIRTAEELVADRRLLAVALGAFGLGDEIDKTFLIRKVLEEGAEAEDALANRLGDARWEGLAKAFAFDQAVPATQIPGFAEGIVETYKERQFEVAVGNQNTGMRLALGLDRELDNLLGTELSENGLWYTIMATPPLRSVFEAALGIPKAAGAIDVDLQLSMFKDKAQSVFGSSSPRHFEDLEAREDLRRLFFVRSELNAVGPSHSSGSVALSLLQSMPRPSSLF